MDQPALNFRDVNRQKLACGDRRITTIWLKLIDHHLFTVEPPNVRHPQGRVNRGAVDLGSRQIDLDCKIRIRVIGDVFRPPRPSGRVGRDFLRGKKSSVSALRANLAGRDLPVRS
jgi:hypothetical protein